MTDTHRENNPLSLFEFWPKSIFYTPIVLYWIIMGIRYLDLSVATAANPRIETGGLCGESKSSIFELAGSVAQEAIAPYRIFYAGSLALQEALHAMEDMKISFPVVVKPDIGCNGTGVRLIKDLPMLEKTLPLFPHGVGLLIQKLIPDPIEVGIFYIRHPHEKDGHLTSMTYKEAPLLVGDGTSTLQELILHDPRMSQVPQLYLPHIQGQENTILTKGEKFPLVFAGNHCKGSIFRDGRDDITEALTHRIDTIMKNIPDFHFGRVDIKTSSIDALKKGRELHIIEINGVGSEAIHIWDRRTTLWEAYRTQFYHYHQTFLIGAAKKKEGWKSFGAFPMLFSWRKQKKLLASYPAND